jgi:hypothetical protein
MEFITLTKGSWHLQLTRTAFADRFPNFPQDQVTYQIQSPASVETLTGFFTLSSAPNGRFEGNLDELAALVEEFHADNLRERVQQLRLQQREETSENNLQYAMGITHAVVMLGVLFLIRRALLR